MTTKTYSVFDPHAVGPSEEIQNGGTVVTCNVDGEDMERSVRSSIGFSSGVHRVQFFVYGEGDMPGKIALGLMTASASLSESVGKNPASVGLRLGDGDIYINDVSVATVPAGQKEVPVDIVLDADNDEATFFVNNNEVATVALASGQTWYYGVSVGCTVAYDLSIYAVTGNVAFTFDQPDNPAWFSETGGAGFLRVCAKTGFLTASGDTPPNVNYDPHIIDDEQFSIRRSVSVWPWANQNSGSTFGALAIDNHDGRYDYLTRIDVRNAKVTFRLAPANGTLDDSFVVGTARINTAKSEGEAKMVLELGDAISTLQRPLQTRIFPPFVDEGVAGRPVPILFGAARNIPAPCIDEEERLFQISDEPISNLAVVRDSGDPLDPLGEPPDFTLVGGQTQVQTNVLPTGKFTVDASSVGTQNSIPGVDDVLAGAGDFTTWTNGANPPDGWTAGGAGSLTRRGVAQGFPQDYVAEITATDPWDPNNGDVGYWLKSPTAVLLAGRSYNITVKLRRAVGGPPNPIGGSQFGLRLQSALDNSPGSAITPFGPNGALQQPLWQEDDQYTFPYTVPAGSDRFLYAVVACSKGATSAIVSFYHIRAELIPLVQQDVPLQGMTLYQLQQDIARRAGLIDNSDIVLDDFADIDAALGYKSFGMWIGLDPVQIVAAMRRPMDSVCGALCEDHLGRIRGRILQDPNAADDSEIVAELSGDEMAWPLDVDVDEATGLTTKGGSRINYEVFSQTDFVSDPTGGGIPYALRTQFMQPSQFMATSTASLPSYYEHARGADPILFILDDPAEGQNQITRVGELYEILPGFFRCTVWLTPRNIQTMAQLLFGDLLRITYPRYGFDAGKKVRVVDTNFMPSGFQIDLTFWRPQE